MGFAHARCKRLLDRRIGCERLALVDADRLQLVDHGTVAVKPRFALHDPIEMDEKALVVADRGIEQDILHISEDRRWRSRGLRNRINLDALAVSDRLCDVGIAMAGEIRTDQGVAAVGLRLQRGIPVWNFSGVAGRQHQELDARALVHAEPPGILERLLPNVDDVGIEGPVGVCRGDLNHDRPDVLGVEECHEVERVWVWSKGLVLPIERPAPVDDLVHLARRLGEHFLQHQVVVDRRHPPDDGLYCAPLNCTASNVGLGGTSGRDQGNGKPRGGNT